MQHYHAIRSVPETAPFDTGDFLVLFGELFNRGYANGLVEEAEKSNMTIVRSTVGRRTADSELRSLNPEEAQQIPKPFINVPLEVGFDLIPDQNGQNVVDKLKDVKLSNWNECRLDFDQIEFSRKAGELSFRKRVKDYFTELAKVVPKGKNVVIAHLMAGGVPRAKIILPLMNRSVKGTGDRFLPSEEFWKSDLGKLCQISFEEVTANSFKYLIEESMPFVDQVRASGADVVFTAYGYHGTEILINDKFQWQTYSPYLQGWAKMKLEDHARYFTKSGIKATVYNCPEILTNSSSIFQGVEICLYPLLLALKKLSANNPKLESEISSMLSLFKDEHSLEKLQTVTSEYFSKQEILDHCQFEKWPQHNRKDQLELMLNQSDSLISWHKDPKHLMTFPLSEIVFKACGYTMLRDCFNPQSSVSWINHDIVAKVYSQQI